jgi:imidazoleglycerol-phosphate dehydratase
MVKIDRKTKETDINLEFNLNGSGECKADTKIGFLNHMINTLSKHSLIDIDLVCNGDIDVDFHHSVEDVGIVLGSAFYKEVFPVKNIERFSNVVAVLDEAGIEVDIDISGRAYLYFDIDIDGKVGNFDVELVEEFFRAFVHNAKITAHITYKRGKNKHHIIEATFKAFAIALRRALTINNRAKSIPTTKGVL